MPDLTSRSGFPMYEMFPRRPDTGTPIPLPTKQKSVAATTGRGEHDLQYDGRGAFGFGGGGGGGGGGGRSSTGELSVGGILAIKASIAELSKQVTLLREEVKEVKVDIAVISTKPAGLTIEQIEDTLRNTLSPSLNHLFNRIGEHVTKLNQSLPLVVASHLAPLLPKDTDNVMKDVQLYLVEADKGQKASEALHPLLTHILTLLTPLTALTTTTTSLTTKLDTTLTSISNDSESRDVLKQSLDNSLRLFGSNLLRRDESLAKVAKESRTELKGEIAEVMGKLSRQDEKVEELMSFIREMKGILGQMTGGHVAAIDEVELKRAEEKGQEAIYQNGIKEPVSLRSVTDDKKEHEVTSNVSTLSGLPIPAEGENTTTETTGSTTAQGLIEPPPITMLLTDVTSADEEGAVAATSSLQLQKSIQLNHNKVVKRTRSNPNAGEKINDRPAEPIRCQDAEDVGEVSKRLMGLRKRKEKDNDEGIVGYHQTECRGYHQPECRVSPLMQPKHLSQPAPQARSTRRRISLSPEVESPEEPLYVASEGAA